MGKNKQTFAQRANSIMSKYKLRLGENFDKPDKEALEAMNRELEMLKNEQEIVRQAEQAKQFTSLLKKAYGGQLPKMDGGSFIPQMEDPWLRQIQGIEPQGRIGEYSDYDTPDYLMRAFNNKTNRNILNMERPDFSADLPRELSDQYLRSQLGNIQPNVNTPRQFNSTGLGDVINEFSTEDPEAIRSDRASLGLDSVDIQRVNPITMEQERKNRMDEEILGNIGERVDQASLSRAGNRRPYESKVSPLGLLASGVGTGLLALGKQPKIKDINAEDYISGERVTPQEISLAREREEARRQGRESTSQLIDLAKTTGGSKSNLFSRALVGITSSDRVEGERVSRSRQAEEVANAQARMRADEINAQLGSREAEIRGNVELQNQRNRYQQALIDQQRRDALIGNLISGVQGYGADLNRARMYDNMLHIASAPTEYGFYEGAPRTGIQGLLTKAGILQTPMDILYKGKRG